jgi:hypothetical protein
LLCQEGASKEGFRWEKDFITQRRGKMHIENMPFCCTSVILGSFGEHGEESLVTVEEIHRLISKKLRVERDLEGRMIDGAKRCVFAISVDPENIRLLRQAGFKVVDHYTGIQGEVYILTFHAGKT